MTEKLYKIHLGNITASGDFKDASRDELRVLLALISRNGRTGDVEELAAAAGVSRARTDAALTLWESVGVIETLGSLTDEFDEPLIDTDISEETSASVALLLRDPNLKEAIDECTRLMKRATLSTPELKKITALNSQLSLSPEYILALAANLAEHGKLTPHRLASTAERYVREDIDTLEALEVHLAEKEKMTAAEWEFRRALGIYGRTTSDTERECFTRWSEEYGYSTEIVRLAYDMAVLGTGERSVPYIDAILRSWHESGCKTVAECKSRAEEHKAEAKTKRATATKKQNPKACAKEEPKYSSFGSDDALMQALLRSYGDEKKGEN